MELALGFGLLALWAWVLAWSLRVIDPKFSGWSFAGLVVVCALCPALGVGVLVYAVALKGRRALTRRQALGDGNS
jgi:hypothetical protein